MWMLLDLPASTLCLHANYRQPNNLHTTASKASAKAKTAFTQIFESLTTFTLLFSHLADAFIQSDLQIRNSNYNYKLKFYKYYIYTLKKIEKLNKMIHSYNNISKLNI